MTFRIGDKEITLVKLKQSKDSQDRVSHYVIFAFTDTGLHISYHPDANPVLQEEKTGRNLAKIDIASARRLDAKDFRRMFRYPRHRSDVLVLVSHGVSWKAFAEDASGSGTTSFNPTPFLRPFLRSWLSSTTMWLAVQ